MNWEVAKQRASLVARVRHFFAEREVVEVETPCLSQGTVTDVHLEAFSVPYSIEGTNDTKLYLQTSPEFAMKRLLARGYQSIYQLGKAFRNEDKGRYHNPEFTMLEWYRLGFDHHMLMNEVADLLVAILDCDIPTMVTYQEAFLSTLAIDPLNASNEDLKALIETRGDLDSWLREEENKDILLQFIFASYIESNIGFDAPVIVHEFPCSQASLAKISNKDPRVAERFEVYFKGLELANGFNELTDAKEQVKRFENDNLERNRLGIEEKPIDHRFISSLNEGIPDCAGVALGIDRLIMIALDKRSIEDVLTFSINDA
ncbi:elongation factor P--(R)-beta-lysine ligase [Thalassotalea fusca]